MPHSSVINSDFSFETITKRFSSRNPSLQHLPAMNSNFIRSYGKKGDPSKGYQNMNKTCKYISVSAYLKKYKGSYQSVYRAAMEHIACPLLLQGNHLVPIIPVGLHLTIFRKERKPANTPTPPKGFVSVLEYIRLSNYKVTKYSLYQKVHRNQVEHKRIGKYLFIKMEEK